MPRLCCKLANQQPARPDLQPAPIAGSEPEPTLLSPAQAQQIYQTWMRRWRITQRFQPPDWSIVDLWVARALLAQGLPVREIQEVLRLGSPAFPRRHGDPADYLRRTLARAFPAFPAPVPSCVPLMPELPRLPRQPTIVRTPPAHDSPARSATACGCTPSPQKPGCNSGPHPDPDTPADTPPRISRSS
jgi:hypothetical protein